MSDPRLTPEDVPIGEALRLLRTRTGFTQKEMADRGGPEFRTISHWETGRKQPSLRLLLQYLTALQFDLHDLQDTLDAIKGRTGNLALRVVAIERRLSVLERGSNENSGADGEDVLS